MNTNRFLKKDSLSDWPLSRKIFTYTRFYLNKYLLNVNLDSSGAFRCYNFKRMNPKLIFFAKNNSYSFFWETIYIFTKEKCKIKDLKVVLPYRVTGTSKLRFRDWFHGLYYLFVVFFKDLFNISYKK